MLEIIETVLEAEQEADRLIASAKEDATRVRNEYAEEESRALRDAQAKADRALRERLAAVRDQQDRRVAEAEERLRDQARSFDAEHVPGLAKAVEEAARLVREGP